MKLRIPTPLARAWSRRSGTGVGHVLMTTDTVGGAWPHAMTLASALARRGVRTSLAVFTGALGASLRAQAWAVPGLQIFEGAFRLEWMRDPWADVRRAGEWLLSLARVLRPDVIHLHGYTLGALGWPAPAVVAAHGCACSWWEALHGTAAPPEWGRYRAEVRRGLLGAARVVAPSRAMLEALQRQHGPLPSARVVHDARVLTPVRGLEKEPWILAAGRVEDEARNVQVLEAAARRVPIRVADGFDEAPGAPARETGLELVGRLGPEAMRVAMARAAIYAHPAVYEPWAHAPLEAALQGCALVLSDIPSHRELFDGAAVFVPPRDGEAWATELRALLDDVPRRRRLAQAARARAGSFRPERQAEEMLRIYEGAVSEARRETAP
ncbi:MAG TPA: glycosyltransferase family 4 protein [Myxococcaceae bacterium]|nr:glycosyltransferase family 4 protein [Myxococcaceae bacterium]